MRKQWFCLVVIVLMVLVLAGCGRDTSESRDQALVNRQQSIYQKVQPVHIYDYSIPRSIYQQIYDVVTTRVVATYTVIESMTGVTRYEGPSVGYAIPADTSFTNPLQMTHQWGRSVAIGQAEPNGLFASRNTDGTWVLFVDLKSGLVYPVYTEHKVTTFPFIVKKNESGQWVRADNKPIAFKLTIKKGPDGATPRLPRVVK
jgi:hypothetical protein